MKRIILSSIFIILCTIASYGFNMKKFSVENGLSNNNVIALAQDREGFIWICTKDGLNRFDGSTFQVFRHENKDINSICSNVLNDVFADPEEDKVWIASEKNGLDSYNYKTQQFTHYTHTNENSISSNGITHIGPARGGNIWIANYSAGIDYLNTKTNHISHFNTKNIAGLVSDFNWYVLEDNDTRLLVGHVSSGLSIINIKNRTAKNYQHNPNDPTSLCDNTVTCIFKDSQQRIWVGTVNGLAIFNPLAHNFINLSNVPSNPNSLSGNFIKSIVETKDGKIWIGTEGNGISILDLKQLSGTFQPSKLIFQRVIAPKTSENIINLSVQALIQDKYGNFWSGGFIDGMNFINNKSKIFQKISYQPNNSDPNNLSSSLVVGLCTDNKNHVWVANGIGGLTLYDKQLKIANFQHIRNETKPLNTSFVCKDSQNNIWVGCGDGRLFQYNPKNNQFKHFKINPDYKSPIYSIFCDSHQFIWISTDIGLYKIDYTGKVLGFFNTNNSKIPDNNIRAVQEDKNGNLWVGTLGGGLQIFTTKMKLIKNIGSHSDFYSISQIYKDSKNRMWVASQNDLFLFPSDNISIFRRFGKRDGLTENNILAVIEGKSANEIWISTTNCISFLDEKKSKVLNYTIADEIAYGNYSSACVTKTASGDIYFGGQHGITYFNEKFKENKCNTPKSVITSFKIVSKNKQHLTTFESTPYSEKSELTYTQNSFQINFNVPDYSLNNKVDFIYQMVGLDNGWYYIGKDKQVTFRNLRPGKYTFNIKTRLQNQAWSDDTTTLTIIIHPPFWLTWWAELFYLIIGCCAIYYIFRFYKKLWKLESSLIFEKQSHEQEQKLNEEKMRFFTNIAHELRTPMTLIIGPLEDVIADKSLSDSMTRKMNSIYRVANRLLDLINQILEFRKTETNNRILSVKKSNIATLLYEIGLRYKELHQKKDITFDFNLSKNLPDLYYDEEVITIILNNLISNAFKYTTEGRITLELKQSNANQLEYTEITVSDTGIGIDNSELPFIFNRYYQASNRKQHTSGTGIGLSLVKNLVDLHEAEIIVKSELNIGSSFTIRLLTNNIYTNALHKEIIERENDFTEDDDINSKQLILIVEDNLDIINYIRDCLVDSYEVITAEDGQDGYSIACDRIPDIIISDIMMPVMNGVEFCRNIKQNVLTSHIPIILLTAKGTLQDKTEGYDAGADSYMTKPFSGNLLRSRIKNLLQNRSKLNESYSSYKNKKMILTESASMVDKEFIEKLSNLIEQNIEYEDMNIAQIALAFNMSHSTLYRKVKALTDLNIAEFIRKIKIRTAEQLLLTNKYNITEVMYKVGYISANHFRQHFKDEFGINPSNYIQKIKKGMNDLDLNV